MKPILDVIFDYQTHTKVFTTDKIQSNTFYTLIIDTLVIDNVKCKSIQCNGSSNNVLTLNIEDKDAEDNKPLKYDNITNQWAIVQSESNSNEFTLYIGEFNSFNNLYGKSAYNLPKSIILYETANCPFNKIHSGYLDLPFSYGSERDTLIMDTIYRFSSTWDRNIAAGVNSIVLGWSNKAFGVGSTISGCYNNVIENNSYCSTISGGSYNTVKGSHSTIVGGYEITTQNDGEIAGGYYNISKTGEEAKDQTLFTIGNGSKSGDRHNAIEIMYNGDVYIVDTTKSGENHELPMIKLQDALFNSKVDLSGYYTKNETDNLFNTLLVFSKDPNGGAYMSGCTANAEKSVAEGNNTNATGQYSHAEGIATTASGYASHTEGGGTKAMGYYSHSEGSGTEAKNDVEHASGQFNNSVKNSSTFGDNKNTLFTVGNGYYISGSTYNHNAFQIMQSGDIYIADPSSNGEYYGKSMIHLQQKLASLASKEDISTAINNLVNGATDAMDTLSELETAINSNKGILETLNEAIVKKADKDEVDQKLAELEENIKVQVYAEDVLISAEDSSTLMEYLDDTEKVIAAALTDLNSRLEEIESLKEEVKELAETVQNLQNGNSGETTGTDTYFTGCNKSTEINNIPVSKHFTTVTISEGGTFQLEDDPEVGRELHIIIKNTSTGAINVQLPEKYSGVSEGTEIAIEANAFVDMNLIYDGETYYIKAMTE